MRVSGTRKECMERIKEHERSSFSINCTGDACKGDVVLFRQNIKKGIKLVGRRTVAGRIVNDSYGASRQQHTFTVEVLWSKRSKKLDPLSVLLVKGRYLYKYGTFSQPWESEAERLIVLGEKHRRGDAARHKRKLRQTGFASSNDKGVASGDMICMKRSAKPIPGNGLLVVVMMVTRERTMMLLAGGDQRFCNGLDLTLNQCTPDHHFPLTAQVMHAKEMMCFLNKMYTSDKRYWGSKELLLEGLLKDIYLAPKRRHDFTIEVLWTKGSLYLSPLSVVVVKDWNVYRFGTLRQPWENEAERSEVLREKHRRAEAANKYKRKLRKTDITSSNNAGIKRQKVSRKGSSRKIQPTQKDKRKSSRELAAAFVKESIKAHKRKAVLFEKTELNRTLLPNFPPHGFPPNLSPLGFPHNQSTFGLMPHQPPHGFNHNLAPYEFLGFGGQWGPNHVFYHPPDYYHRSCLLDNSGSHTGVNEKSLLDVATGPSDVLPDLGPFGNVFNLPNGSAIDGNTAMNELLSKPSWTSAYENNKSQELEVNLSKKFNSLERENVGLRRDLEWVMRKAILRMLAKVLRSEQFDNEMLKVQKIFHAKLRMLLEVEEDQIGMHGDFPRVKGRVADVLYKDLSSKLSDFDTAFLPNRQILDGPFIINEILARCKLKKQQAIIFKVDFAKAFRSVWECIRNGGAIDGNTAMNELLSKPSWTSAYENNKVQVKAEQGFEAMTGVEPSYVSDACGYMAYPNDVPQLNPAQLPFNESSGGSSAYYQRRVEELFSSRYQTEGMLAMAQAMNGSMQTTVNSLRSENESLKSYYSMSCAGYNNFFGDLTRAKELEVNLSKKFNSLEREKIGLRRDLEWVMRKAIPRMLAKVLRSEQFDNEMLKVQKECMETVLSSPDLSPNLLRGVLERGDSSAAKFSIAARPLRSSNKSRLSRRSVLLAGNTCIDDLGRIIVHCGPEVFTDSLLVANHAKGTYEAREETMIQYLAQVQSLQERFMSFLITQSSHTKNKRDDALSKLASSSFAHLTKKGLVEVIPCRSTEIKTVNTVEEPYTTWMDPIISYLKDEHLLEDPIAARKIRVKAPQYSLKQAVILKKLPEKLGDPGKFLIPCGFSELKCKALVDLGASINLMPLSVWRKLGLPDLIPTQMTLELANRRPFLRTARALINVHGEEMILRDGDERLTLNMKHDTTSYSNHPYRESVNLINIFNLSSKDCLQDLVSIKQSGNPTFSLHKEIASPEVIPDFHDSKGCNFLSKELPDIDSFNDIHPHFDDDPLSGITDHS
nr:hypothetical protein [Tanacetum cinerariifolium]